MLRRVLLAFLGLSLATPAVAQDAPYQRQARQILERLVSFRTAAGQGQVPPMIAYIQQTLARRRRRRRGHGRHPARGDRRFAGGVHGADQGDRAHARPILFSAHMDVVDARPEDWERSPFTLVEENGYLLRPRRARQQDRRHLDDLDHLEDARRQPQARAPPWSSPSSATRRRRSAPPGWSPPIPGCAAPATRSTPMPAAA